MAQAQLSAADIDAWRNRPLDESDEEMADEKSDYEVGDETLMEIELQSPEKRYREAERNESPAKRQRVEEEAFDLRLKSQKTFGNTAAMNTFTVSVTENLKLSYNKISDQIENIFDKAIQEVAENSGVEFTKGKIVLHAKDLEPIIIPLQQYKNLSGKLVVDTVNDVLQSHQEVELDSDDFEITISTLSIPSGSGPTPYNNPNCAYSKKTVCEVVDPSVTCLAQAIAIGFAKISVIDNMPKCARGQQNKVLLESGKCSKSHYSTIRMKSRNERLDLAKLLCTRVGVSTKGVLSIADINKFEKLVKCNIIAISTVCGNQVLHSGCGEYEKYLFVLHTLNAKGKGHFNTISDICKFYGLGNYCFPCLKAFRSGQHKCANYCNLCEAKGCIPDEPAKCVACNFTFRSTDCLERHLQPPPKENYKGNNKGMDEDLRKSRCDKIKICPDCGACLLQSKRTLKEHVCFETYCNFCKEYVSEENHLCYQRITEVTETPQKLLFFDVEASTSEETVECDGGYQIDLKTGKCINCSRLYCGRSKHVPVLIVSETACGDCQDKDVTDTSQCANCGSRCKACNQKKGGSYIKTPCAETCGLRRNIFYGETACHDFYAFLVTPDHKNVTVMAHNSSRYDSYFLLERALNCGAKIDNVCFSGSKMIFMQLPNNIMCIDSYSFMPSALSKFKDTYGLDVDCEKFDFPYSFIKFSNLNYVGPWPSLEQYNTNRYETKEDKDEFVKWHAEQCSKTFNFKEELIKYCVQDVSILRKGALKFQKLIYDLTIEMDEEKDEMVFPGILAFTKPTIASLAMHVFRSRFLWETHIVENPSGERLTARYRARQYYLENNRGKWEKAENLSFVQFVDSPIAACPNDNYMKKDNFSRVSMEWLLWEQKRLGVTIQTALSPEGEKKVPTSSKVVYRLDGYVKAEDNHGKPLALEFMGCFYHGHGITPGCSHKYVKDTEAWKSAKEQYDRTQFKIKNLRDLGYEVKVMWECQYRKRLTKNPEMKAFVDGVKVAPRLNIREGIYGGRVSPVTLMAEAAGGNDKIHFADFCSLYPSQMRDGKFMVGHPQILRDVDPSRVPNLFGYAYCKILPPQSLFFPVLPSRVDGKLLFVLCRTCGANKQTDECEHAEDQRCIEGVYTTEELQKAVELGYKVMEIYEAWHWEQTTQYKKGTDFTGLFAGYVNLFLKVKTESSGWPSGVETEEEKDRYIQDYYDREGIILDKANISNNPAIRSVAKLLLNSQFGKYIQKSDRGATKFFYLKDLSKLHEIMLDPNQKITDFHILSENNIMIELKTSSTHQTECQFTNPAIGGLITSYGRMKLFGTLNSLQEKVLYYDTDSVMFTGGNKIEDSVPIAPYLGELENELKGDDYVERFVSLGCKSYAYSTKNGKNVVKAKGFTLKGQPAVNIDSMQEILLNEREERFGLDEEPKKKQITIEQFNIRRVKQKQALYNTTETKSFRFTFDKRMLNWEDFSSLPYGYK